MKTLVFPVLVGFGDCDPAGIVFYPNFFRWFDASTHALLNAAGQSHDAMQREHGWVLGPLVDAGAAFRAPARYNERIEIHSAIERWSAKTFRISHRAMRDGTLLAEGWEVRFIGVPHPDDPRRLRALAIPGWFRALFDDDAPQSADAAMSAAAPPAPGSADASASREPAGGERRLHLLDTITSIDESCRDGIIVSGSHGGLSSTGFVLRAPVRPRAVFLNDAGVGRDKAGIVALDLLEEIGVACGCYAHESARIGEARDGYERGVLSHLNPRAQAAGLSIGMSVREAVALLGVAPDADLAGDDAQAPAAR
ncbi:acyl-CoA thioesterase [Burkholderiaceae bacterium FT117]|uniref:acyl-CoA thioesterase n=1 Tax=Zeimonas sediminis TaxID=2944268 RepID=UPI002342C524|nr:acyl-CoA thioesterase [Zeimonas sediminis]MCM5571345.1 acyl-CoA thioesterase [Zeimonas sediminis]